MSHSPEVARLLTETTKESVPIHVNGEGKQIKGPISYIFGENYPVSDQGQERQYPIPVFLASGENQLWSGE